ncbi:hypothetical protein RB201_31950 [Streptomyces sp. S1A(2023)]
MPPHLTLPHLSQGANQALEDAVVLVRCRQNTRPGGLAGVVRATTPCAACDEPR